MLERLAPREKLIVLGGVAVLAALLFVYACVLPLLERRERSQRQIISLQKELHEILAYQDEYKLIQAENLLTAAILKKRPADFSLFSFLDQLAGSTGIKNKIIYMKPSIVPDSTKQINRSRVEIKLDEVNLEQICRFLYRIESAPHRISVPRLSIKKKQQESGLLETVLQVETVETTVSRVLGYCPFTRGNPAADRA